MKIFLIFIFAVFAEESSGESSGDGEVERDSLTDDDDFSASDRSSLLDRIKGLEQENWSKDLTIENLKDDLEKMTRKKNLFKGKLRNEKGETQAIPFNLMDITTIQATNRSSPEQPIYPAYPPSRHQLSYNSEIIYE
ncbi:Oidioi.mRNA.OKI2018_I69.chr1.g897.t1.cds [Oikopleura dioica]|uniref:Oidioi.mRNA.OKI2018_I69.chr1.g897.t1.cds n=1 Tax=Oikopleura dioica TaxID=34765 RepID=A0ABN7SRI4_OIKDI|nr:Oidioi.mRNA.OKI2018_I69.chr1.g897.t1.cds [Oikopleura dioica]